MAKDNERFNQGIGSVDIRNAETVFNLGEIDQSDGTQFVYITQESEVTVMLGPDEAHLLACYLALVLK
jgi:hypothetical protein